MISFTMLASLLTVASALSKTTRIVGDPSSALPTLFSEHTTSGLGKEYDQFRAEVQGLKIVRDDSLSQQGSIRGGRRLNSNSVFEIQHSLSFDGDLIYARGYIMNSCICGLNVTSGTQSCSYVSAKQIGGSTSYNVTFNYYNGATANCNGAPSSVVLNHYTPSSFSYKGCSGKTYYVNSTYGITSEVGYLFYPQGLVTFHYGSATSCASGDFTDYKYSGFTTCGETFLPCTPNSNSTTFYGINYNSIGIKSYTDATCTTQTAQTEITAVASCLSGSFDDDIDTDVVQNYFGWYVVNYPLSININDDFVSLSRGTYGGLVAAVFIAFLVGIGCTACICHFFFKSSGSGGLSSREENNKL